MHSPQHSFLLLQFTWLFAVLSFSAPALTADNLPFDQETQPETNSWRWLEEMADSALATGLPALAEDFYRKILSENAASEKDVRNIQLQLVTALIGQGAFQEAELLLEAMPPPYSAAYYLRKALAAYHKGSLLGIQAMLDKIEINSLASADVPWFYILQGLSAERNDDRAKASELYAKALDSSVTAVQKAQIDILIKRGQIIAGDFSKKLLSSLEDKYRQNMGTKIGYGYAREYAVALLRGGNKDEALNILNEQIQLMGLEHNAEKDRTQLLVALIAGVDTFAGTSALQSILFRRGDVEIGRIALNLWSQALKTDDERKQFSKILDDLIGSTESQTVHPLLDHLLNLRAQLRLAEGNLPAAEADAKQLIETFPGSGLIKNAMWLRAYIAWSDAPPRYRLAADLLNQIKSEADSPELRLLLSVLTADCYFLNGDFDTSANLYLSALRSSYAEASSYSLLFRLVESEIRLERFDRAAEHLDDPEFLKITSLSDRWRCEWNLMEALRSSDNILVAFERLNRLLDNQSDTIPASLLVRMLWMKAYLSLQVGTYDQLLDIPKIADTILSIVTGLQNNDSMLANQSLVISYTLLVKGQALLKTAEVAAGLQTFAALRQDYSDSQPAILSYLEEARYYAGQDKTADAQSLSVTLADRYPDSPYAPVALYEAAIYAQRQGLDRNKGEATELLEKLCTQYAEHPLAFYARLMQGDILRSLNNFGDARNVYEYLINNFPDHPEIYLAELYRVRCLIAQSTRNKDYLNAAESGLERLLDLPDAPIDLKVEAGYTLGMVYVNQNKTLRAKEIFWQVISQYLKKPTVALQPKGRYWMAKVILDLGELLASEGQFTDAGNVYSLIIDHNLPGINLAKSRIP